MDNSQEGKIHFADKNMCHCGGGHHRAWHVLKWLLVILLISVAFHAGARIGGRGDMRKGFGGPHMNISAPRMANVEMDQVFGEITQVAGPVITILDNGGKTQVVVSTSDTRILIGNQEIGLSSLKAGQNIRAIGTLKEDSRLEARLIQLAGI